jgi:hypothetical protein
MTCDTQHPGFWKLELSAKGVRLDGSVAAIGNLLRDPPGGASSGRSLEIVLPEDVWVSVQIDDADTGSPYLLTGEADHFFLQRNGSCVDVRLVPQPGFYRLTTSGGTPMSQVAAVYGGAIAIAPSGSCGFGFRGAPCDFCCGKTTQGATELGVSVADVVEVTQAAFEEGAAEFVLFNVPYTDTEDAGVTLLEPYLKAIKRHFDTAVAVQLHPPDKDHWIDQAYAMGVDAVGYSVDFMDAAALAAHCPGRARSIGQARTLAALRHAAAVFPSGTVWSDLVVGLEPAEATIGAIDALAGAGVLPVLCYPGPRVRDSLRAPALASVEDAAAVFAHLFRAVRDAKINMGWVRDLSFAITPFEARFFAGDEARKAGAMQQFYRSRVGSMTARNLSRLRRRLRVRRVSDSFDSSNL